MLAGQPGLLFEQERRCDTLPTTRSPAPGARLRFFAALGGAGLLALAAGAVLAVHELKREVVAGWVARLRAAAEDREVLFSTWLSERFADGRVLATYPTTTKLLATPPGDPAARAALVAHEQEILKSPLEAYGYTALALFDASGARIVAAGRAADLDPEEVVDMARRTAAGSLPEARFVLLNPGSTARLVAAVPAKGGAVVLVSDPERFLYPLLRREAAQTRTGEALLVHREGPLLRIVRPTREAKGPPLSITLQYQTTDPTLRAAVDVVEQTGEAVDYRGVKVLESTRGVPGMAAGMVVKVDLDEVLVPVRRAALWASACVIALVLAFLAAGFGIWSEDRLRHARDEARHADRFRIVTEEANDAMVFVRPSDGRIIHANRAATELWGYSREELANLTVDDLPPADLRSVLAGRAADALRTGTRYEAIHVRKDGGRCTVEVSARNVDFGGEAIVFLVVRDVTEARASQERLATLSRLYRTISEANQLLVREADVEALLAAACRIIVEEGGLAMAWVGRLDTAAGVVTPAATAGRVDGYLDAVSARTDDGPLSRRPLATALREGRVVVANDWETLPGPSLARDEALRRGYRSTAAFPIAFDGGVWGVLVVYSDEPGFFSPEIVTLLGELADDVGFALATHERTRSLAAAQEEVRNLNAQLEERVRQRTAALEEKSAELEAFAYSVSHDLRAPLRAVDGFARILEEEHGAALDAEGRRVVGVIRDGARRMGELIEAILRLSRVGRQQLRTTDVDLETLVRAAWSRLVPDGSRPPATLRVGPLPRTRGDVALLTQAVENLLSNALKFSATRAERIVEVGSIPDGDGPAYFVRDNGVGFDPAYAHKLFGVFQRLHAADEFDGTGIGLALVHRIVSRHGGRIRAESAPGSGATFLFTLPTGSGGEERGE